MSFTPGERPATHLYEVENLTITRFAEDSVVVGSPVSYQCPYVQRIRRKIADVKPSS